MHKLTLAFLGLSVFSSLAACGDDGSADSSADTLLTLGGTADSNSGAEDPSGTGTEDPSGTGTEDPTGEPTGDPMGGFCVHQCGSDADCEVGGMDVGLSCVDSLCTGASSSCAGDQECVQLFSGWVTACTAGGGECDATAQVCVAVDGGGLCATPPSDFVTCEQLGWAELATTDIDGAPVVVCAQTKAECSPDAYCFLPCSADADCPGDAYPICNVSSGQCQCGADADCATLGLANLSVCNAGVCGCGIDQDCIDGAAGDVCNQGACGCTDDTACAGVMNGYDGGMISCVQL